MNWMFLPLKRYADFQGRSRRKEYWMFFLLMLIIGFVIGVVAGATAPSVPLGPDGYADPEAAAAATMAIYSSPAFMIGGLIWLALLIPSIAVTVRRLHDQDKSGWLVLLAFIPFVGGLILLVFMLLEGTRGPNRFGPDPKEVGEP
jgi:uncharacterized membrane protein YhaH (DUF805 family)